MNNLKCTVCGQFISPSDFMSGAASANMIYPDSDLTDETWEILCPRHNMRNKMEVLKYLHTHSLKDLNEEHGIKVKEYPDYNIAVLNYDQLNSSKYHPIVKECRGLIINTKELTPVSVTFNRFFNLNEDINDKFMWHTPFIVEEKADGSLMSVYHHIDSWHIASRGNAFAEGTTSTGMTFHEIFESIIKTDINTFMKDHNPLLNFVFEMCSLHNKVVKIYEESRLYLLSIHTKLEGELPPFMVDEVAEDFGVLRPKVYNIESVEDIHKSFEDFEPTDEGYVLIDERGHRIKIKNPTYVDLHHLKGNGEITPKRISEVIFRGETDEVLGYFPEFREIFMPYQAAYDTLVEACERLEFLINDKTLTQKEFALKIIHLYYSNVLFGLRKGLTIEEVFGNMGANVKADLLMKTIKNGETK